MSCFLDSISVEFFLSGRVNGIVKQTETSTTILHEPENPNLQISLIVREWVWTPSILFPAGLVSYLQNANPMAYKNDDQVTMIVPDIELLYMYGCHKTCDSTHIAGHDPNSCHTIKPRAKWKGGITWEINWTFPVCYLGYGLSVYSPCASGV